MIQQKRSQKLLLLILLILLVFGAILYQRKHSESNIPFSTVPLPESKTDGKDQLPEPETTTPSTISNDTTSDKDITKDDCSSWQADIKTSSLETVTFKHQNTERSYELYIPSKLEGCTQLTLLVGLHGGEGTGEKIAHTTHLVDKAESEGYILVLPNSGGSQWNDGRETTKSNRDDVGFITSIVDQLIVKNKVAQDKVFVVGVSNGGMMTQRLLCDTNGTFAGGSVIVANLPAELVGVCTNYDVTPIVFFTGTADKIMPYEGGNITSSARLGFGVGGIVLSAAATEEFWKTKNFCVGNPITQTLSNKSTTDGTTVSVRSYTNCRSGGLLKVFTINEGGHNWPGSTANSNFVSGNISQDIDATAETISFFKTYGF